MPTAIAVRHVAFEDLGTFSHVLRARGWTIEYVDATELRAAEVQRREPELVVILGGPLSVHDAELFPFLAEEQQLLASRLRNDQPTIGICLGAQLMARVLGATVSPMRRQEIGFSPLDLVQVPAQHPLVALANDVPVLHWHGEECTLPEGAMLWASTPACKTQIFAYRANALALQCHLEADTTQLERWYVGHIIELNHAGIAVNDLRRQAAAHGARLRERASEFFQRWLDERQL